LVQILAPYTRVIKESAKDASASAHEPRVDATEAFVDAAPQDAPVSPPAATPKRLQRIRKADDAPM
jgi:hypothetical protein